MDKWVRLSRPVSYVYLGGFYDVIIKGLTVFMLPIFWTSITLFHYPVDKWVRLSHSISYTFECFYAILLSGY